MLNSVSKILAASAIAFGASTAVAWADSCSGHSHPTGTILGAVGGGLIGSQLGHGALPVVGGAVAGGFAGNAIERSIDCRHHAHYYRSSRYYRDHHRYYRDDNGYYHDYNRDDYASRY